MNYNNAQIQSNAGNLAFTQDSEDVYDIVIEYDTGVGTKGYKHHIVTQHKHTDLTTTVNYDTKVKKQVVGFNLTGIAGEVVDGPELPHIGDSSNEGNGAIVTDIIRVFHTESNLKVNSVELVPAPVVTDPTTVTQ